MCSERPLLIVCWVGLLAVASTAASAAEPVRLKLTPDTCVALQQGRQCYATIQIDWHSQTALDLCLHAGSRKLQCWQASNSGRLRYEFVAADNERIQLVGTDGILAEATIKVNWVQKNTKVKRHWRLF
ncbi:DUF3019 domain-containing protein [Rheinheimera texasensis]|uniref:DUF3019 domain-containing protein n=1 Tax=Rheinheimera texasensis TaxID=306205 RepID=UPI0004E18D04|nr:DUF3019 domain-containing protein [Rheinheimera texasensis]